MPVYVTKIHAMKTYRESGASRIPNLGTTWRWVKFHARVILSRGKSPRYPRAVMKTVKINLPLPTIELRFSGRPAYSLVTIRMYCLGHESPRYVRCGLTLSSRLQQHPQDGAYIFPKIMEGKKV
jgi:hypothetical protein